MIVILNFFGQLLLVLIKLTRACFRPHSQGPLLPGPSRRKRMMLTHYATSWRQINQCVQVGRLVAAICRCDKSLRVCWRPFGKIFVSATEFCRCNKSQKKKIVRLVAATKFCCSQKDFHKRSPVHTKRFVAAKSRRHMLLQLLSRSVYRPLGFYRNIS